MSPFGGLAIEPLAVPPGGSPMPAKATAFPQKAKQTQAEVNPSEDAPYYERIFAGRHGAGHLYA